MLEDELWRQDAPGVPAGEQPGEQPSATQGIVPARTTPAGEVEPALPDPVAPDAPAAPTPLETTIAAAASRDVLMARAARAYTQREVEKDRGTPDSREAPLPKRKVAPVPAVPITTDETLDLDLVRSLELADAVPEADEEEGVLPEGAAASLTPVVCDLPTSLDELPLFAYVSGPAGVGKTFWAKEVARVNGERVCLAATTGIASVNLGEGTTINALLKYFDTNSLREAYTGGYLEAMLKRHRGLGLERILLDEVSMLPAEQLTILTRAIDNVNQDKPEGVPDMGLILLGDFCQLSPVPDRDPADPSGRKKLPVGFAFDSPEWPRYADHHLKLRTIRRQADRAFVEALQAVRRGAIGQALEYFGPRLVPTTDMNFLGPTVVAKNDAVGKYNQLRLDAVKGAAVDFASTRWGKLRPEWGGPPKPEHEWGIPPVLRLKVGARVMILANKNIGGKDEPPLWAYTNGDLGTFVGGAHGVARVVLDRTGTEVGVTPLDRFNEIPMEPGRRKALRAEGHPERISEDGKREYIGGITYVPLRLAYATTTHKSQGLSLDQVQVNIRDHFFSQPGMLYVALSRARTAEGLRLVGSVEAFRARCNVNPRLKEFL